MLPSKVLELSLARNRRDGWIPRGPTRHYREGGRCCFLTAMCRALRTVSPQGFALPEAFEAREALRNQVGPEIAAWNDGCSSFREVEEGVMRAVRALQGRGR